jgi:hypothetical protein
MKLTTHLQLMLRLIMSDVTPLSPYMPSWHGEGLHLVGS